MLTTPTESLDGRKHRNITRFGRSGLAGLVVIPLLVLASRTKNSARPAGGEGYSNQVEAPARTPLRLSPAAEAALRGWIAAGDLPDLRWPDFSDYRIHVKNFYESANYVLAWVRNAQPTPQALAIIEVLKDADSKGLHAEDYDARRFAERIRGLGRSPNAPPDLDFGKFDLALTVCVMRYVSDFHIGKVNPKTFHFGLDIEQNKYDLASFLRQRLVDVNAQNVKGVLDSVEPPFKGYRRTQNALQVYQELAKKDDGGQLPLPNKLVKPGDPYPGVPRLTRLLRLLGDLPPDAAVNPDAPVYGGPLVDAVKHFQLRHGLDTSGLLDAETLQELNVPLSRRVEQLRLTLERWRWAPHEFVRPPIIVNIPEFVLRCWNEQQHSDLTMKVVVGQAYHHKTPVFSGQMRYTIFRPYWDVPPSILRNEIVPKIEKDPTYLVKEDFEIVNRDGHVSGDAITPDTLSQLRSGRLSLRQKPGPKNALGLVKFVLPNQYNVYLHSTPARELFERSRRDFSHGCIRVDDPVGLASWVLRDKPQWTRERIVAAMNGGQTVQVGLDKPIPALIVYGTAVVLENGEIHFYEDIYGYDNELEDVLARGYPYP